MTTHPTHLLIDWQSGDAVACGAEFDGERDGAIDVRDVTCLACLALANDVIRQRTEANAEVLETFYQCDVPDVAHPGFPCRHPQPNPELDDTRTDEEIDRELDDEDREASIIGMVRIPDRSTSVEAAKRVRKRTDGLRFAVLEAFREHGRMTDEELRDQLRLKGIITAHSSAPKRRSELMLTGHVRDAGIVRPNRGGYNMIVWELTEEAETLDAPGVPAHQIPLDEAIADLLIRAFYDHAEAESESGIVSDAEAEQMLADARPFVSRRMYGQIREWVDSYTGKS